MFERVHSFFRDNIFIGAFVTRHKFTIKQCVYLDVVIFGHNALARTQFHLHLRGIGEVRYA